MRSSTSDPGSLNTRLLGTLLLGVVAAPLIYLVAEETGYALAYQGCDARSNSWSLVPTVAALVITIVIGVITIGAHRRASRERIPMPFIGWLAIGMAGFVVLTLCASAIAPLILHPCD